MLGEPFSDVDVEEGKAAAEVTVAVMISEGSLLLAVLGRVGSDVDLDGVKLEERGTDAVVRTVIGSPNQDILSPVAVGRRMMLVKIEASSNKTDLEV